MNVIDNLKELREKKSLSKEELAKKLKVSERLITRLENKTSKPDDKLVKKLNKILLDEPKEEKPREENKKIKKDLDEFTVKDRGIMHGLAKATYVIAKVCRILIYIAIPFLVLSLFLIPLFVSRIKISDDSISFKINEANEFKITSNAPLVVSGYRVTYNDTILNDHLELDFLNQIKATFNEKNMSKIYLGIEIIIVIAITSLYLVIVVLKNLEKLMMNIQHDEPFVKDNYLCLSTMGYYMAAVIVCNLIVSIISGYCFTFDVESGIDLFSVVEILFLLAISYVFKLGYIETNQEK